MVTKSSNQSSTEKAVTKGQQELKLKTDSISISSKNRFFDRELSWLAFNERVLELAEDNKIPILERVNFLAIFASNLDEFFMVRVAGLKRRIDAGIAKPTVSGKSPTKELLDILTVSKNLVQRSQTCFKESIFPLLKSHKINIIKFNELNDVRKKYFEKFFYKKVFPILTPLAVDPSHPFPYISGLSLNIAVTLKDDNDHSKKFARIKIPNNIPRFLIVPKKREIFSKEPIGNVEFLPIEDLVSQYISSLFPGMHVKNTSVFRVTRNEDLEVEEDDVENLLVTMESEILQRKFGAPIRLEINNNMPKQVQKVLFSELKISKSETHIFETCLDYSSLFEIYDIDKPKLKYSKFVPSTHSQLAAVESATPQNFFPRISERDILLHHPYDSFSTSVQEFLTQAVNDPKVVAIKQTLYRTGKNSPISKLLIDAANSGKQVMVLVELKARFDEDKNIKWAKELEKAGVHVIYGLVGLKTHSKLLMVVRQEGDSLKTYCHIGTGNYNATTARIYEDFGLLTANTAICSDVNLLFNMLSGFAPATKFSKLLVSPENIRKGIIKLIRNEINNKKNGKNAWIKMKLNSIIDEKIIDSLYSASIAGVKVDLIVRGICGVRPGIKGLSENIKVYSILGRFLEHSRVFAFCNNDSNTVYIGSADMMHRNLDRRVETLVDLESIEHKKSLISMLNDMTKCSSWNLMSDGTWIPKRYIKNGRPVFEIQQKQIDNHLKPKKGKLEASMTNTLNE